jgi:uncharacterized membrane protein
MDTPARVFDHPIHPMLIPFPIGLWVFSLVADLVYRFGGDPMWLSIAYWTMVGGTIGAIIAAVPGVIDFISLRDRTAIRIATVHMTLNIVILLLFVANLGLRTRGYSPTGVPFVLSVVAVALLLVSGWLGWELTYRQGVAISPTIDVRQRARKGAA